MCGEEARRTRKISESGRLWRPLSSTGFLRYRPRERAVGGLGGAVSTIGAARFEATAPDRFTPSLHSRVEPSLDGIATPDAFEDRHDFGVELWIVVRSYQRNERAGGCFEQTHSRG